MSDKSEKPAPPRAASGAVLGRLAVGAILSTPVAAVAAVAGATPATAAPAPPASTAPASTTPASTTPDRVAPVVPPSCGRTVAEVATSVAGIRAQFQASFTAGAVSPASIDLTAIICET